jgi:regulatory protein
MAITLVQRPQNGDGEKPQRNGPSKISAIKAQIKRAGRYSIFVDEKYSFSLSDTALLDAKITVGQEVTEKQIREYKQLSDDDKIYGRALQYIAIRARSEWELRTYLERKGASSHLTDIILSKLSDMQYVDDRKFAVSFVSDRRLLRPTSRRKLILELRKKHISSDIINDVVSNEPEDEQSALAVIVEKKRRQSRYQDDKKLMQYLAGQGFGYSDIKAALRVEEEY